MSNSVPVTAFGDCARDGCDEPCPWDMSAIVFDDETVCCSPDCALTVLEGVEETPETVTLHDPQFVVDRDRLGVGGDVVDFVHEIGEMPEAEEAIREAAMLHEPRFRVSEVS